MLRPLAIAALALAVALQPQLLAAAAAGVAPTSWQRVGNESVIDVGPGWRTPEAAWDSHEIGTMSVVHANGTYHMYYEACAYNGGHPLRALRIGHASSADGIEWTKDAEPVLLGCPLPTDACSRRTDPTRTRQTD